MKTIVVGDIHGHVDSVEKALAFDGNVVFVGDYLDSFSQSVENQVRCLTMVLDAIEDNPGRVVGLLGNHEMSYLDTTMRCSGYKMDTHQHIKHLHNRMLRFLREYWWVDDYLISHAGIDQELLDQLNITWQEYLLVGKFKQIGSYRGGYDHAGGLYWNDFNAEMIPPAGLKQVVGHTNSNRQHMTDGVRLKCNKDNTGRTWCVDNLNRKAEVLLIDSELDEPILYDLDTGNKADEDE